MAVESDDVGPGWDKVSPPQKGGGGRRTDDGLSLFMRLTPNPEPYRIRLGCTPIRFRRHSWAFRALKQWPISPATDPSEKDLDIAWNEGKFMPKTKYAAVVFDRNNNNRLRVLEESPDVFGPIGNHAHLTKMNAASPTKGSDWIVRVTEEVVSGKKTRKYEVAVDTTKGPTPFTDDEIKALSNPKLSREELESRYFKKSTPEEIKDLYEQLPEGSRVNEPRKDDSQEKPAQQRQASTQQAAKPVQKPVAPAAPKQEQKAAPAPTAKLSDDFLTESSADNAGGPASTDGDDVPARMF